MERALLKKTFFIPFLSVVLIPFSGTASPDNGGFSEFLNKTVGSIEEIQQVPETRTLRDENNQSTDTTWNPPQNNDGYYNDKNTATFSNNIPSRYKRGFQNTDTDQSRLPRRPSANRNKNTSSAYQETFPQNYTEDNSFSDSEKRGGINADIPVGVGRFQSQRDQNIYLDGIQDYVDGLVDKDGTPIEQSRIGRVKKSTSLYGKTYSQRHNRK